MTWDYRLVRMDVKCPDREWYEVHEIAEVEDGGYWSMGIVRLDGGTVAEIQHEVHLVAAAIYGTEPMLESNLIECPFNNAEYIGVGATHKLINEILQEDDNV